ncbi:MAG: tetratricopeptide repeat protein [Myxococcota bacterium]
MRSLDVRKGLVLILALVFGATTVMAAESETPASGTEWWYVLRARANMKIGNYRAAIESYEKAAELNPDNREALKQLGVANEKQGLTTKAIEAYDRYLARFDDDPDVAFKQADILGWERYAYRRADAIRYYRMGLAKREDLERRHKLARLLAQDRSQLAPALAEYRKLLAARPGEAKWRAEYRELLLWDPSHLDEAIAEYRKLEKERPGDFEVERRLAELIARKDPKSDEAERRYAALVARRPDDAKLRLIHAELLGADPRKRDRAIEAYREALDRNPRYDVRETYADLLSSDPGRRAEAVMQYGVLLREKPADAGVRLKLARLLAAKRQDTRAAIGEYDAVLARDPENVEAHEGLAQAWAWLGDRDQALHHSNLALRYGAAAQKSARLRGDLLEGRERSAGPIARGLVQEGGSKTELRGVVVGARGRGDVTPFLTLGGEVGFEDYFRSGSGGQSGNNQAAGYLEIDGEYRLDPQRRIQAGLGYHSLTQSARDVLGRVAYESDGERFDWRVGFERKLRFDSFAALAGDSVAGQSIGAARENRFSARLGREGERVVASIEPYAGWVDARGIDANPFVGIRGDVRGKLGELGIVEFWPYYRANVFHYENDAFGVDPAVSTPDAGGYFSPQFYAEQVPGLRMEGHWGKAHEFTLEGGPAAQFVNESHGTMRFELGGHARLAYVLALRESIDWTLDLSFTRIGDVYTRGEATTSLNFRF